MITSIEIVNFQAIEKASLNLSRFTVVTGPTGSGKSAVIRAVKLVVSNARGTAFVRHGQKTCKAGLGFQDENLVVGIERGGRGKDAYRMAWLGEDGQVKTQEFTKLAGGVPEEVTAELKLTDLNFAGQFDSPFLLLSSGSEVARRLGELTNVTVLFEAAREANRRRQAIAADLKKAEVSLALLREQARQHQDLQDRRYALAAAELAYAAAGEVAGQLNHLRALARQLAQAQEQVAACDKTLAGREVPSLARAEELQKQITRLRQLRYADADSAGAAAGHQFAIEHAVLAEQAAHKTLHGVLADAGRCPTCGQQTTGFGQLAVQLFGNRAS